VEEAVEVLRQAQSQQVKMAIEKRERERAGKKIRLR